MSPSFIACNLRFRQVLALADRWAPRASPLALIGEAGVGKQRLARRIHAASHRSGPFEVLEAGRDRALLDLRGHEDGVFSGAAGASPGLLERARGGTLYIERLGEQPPLVQAALERVLDGEALRRFGGHQERVVDVRIIAGARRPLKALSGLRAGLAHRLAALVLEIPPLRERPEDVPWLAQDILARGPGPKLLTAAALDLLLAQPWPGNLRELAAVLSAACLHAEEAKALDAAAIARVLGAAELTPFEALRRRHRRELSRAIDAALANSGGRKGPAAKALGLSRHALRRLQERLAQSEA